MLDQRLLRENPELIVEQLGRRGIALDLTGLQMIARQERDLEQQRSDLQAEGNRIGRQVGERIRAGEAPHSPEVQALRDRGNTIKQQVTVLEEEEKSLEARLRDQLLAFPNLPSPSALTAPVKPRTWSGVAGAPPGSRWPGSHPSRSTGRSPNASV